MYYWSVPVLAEYSACTNVHVHVYVYYIVHVHVQYYTLHVVFTM